MLATIFSAALQGIEAELVHVEVNSGERGDPKLILVGLPDAAVKESDDRVSSALANSGFAMPRTRTTINLAPGHLRKEGPCYDLPIALGLLVATEQLQTTRTDDLLIAGELSLSGATRPVRGALAMARLARSLGRRGLILPVESAREAALVEGVAVYPVASLDEAFRFLAGERDIPPVPHADALALTRTTDEAPTGDFSEVKGQHALRRAVEVAVAGGHNIVTLGTVSQKRSECAEEVRRKRRGMSQHSQGSGNVRQAKENALANAFSRSPSGLKYSTARHQPGRGSDFISQFKGAQKVVLLCRASRRQQTNSPDQQEQAARSAVRALGGRVVGVFTGIENSTTRGLESSPGRDLLVRAIEYAAANGAFLVATERDRFLRTRTYRGRIRNRKTGHDLETPTIAEFAWLIEQAGSVRLATIAHPDSPARAVQIKRGQENTDLPVGRPAAEMRGPGYCARRRRALVGEALRLRKAGMSYRAIARELNRKKGWPKLVHKTVANWCNENGV